ncbi:MAG TPA: hypothetical protein VHA74_00960 [Candidatus Dojkabacteria bacterium]|nr:hypothetical protein [Candidatus Dojkabacteria bacterium]
MGNIPTQGFSDGLDMQKVGYQKLESLREAQAYVRNGVEAVRVFLAPGGSIIVGRDSKGKGDRQISLVEFEYTNVSRRQLILKRNELGYDLENACDYNQQAFEIYDPELGIFCSNDIKGLSEGDVAFFRLGIGSRYDRKAFALVSRKGCAIFVDLSNEAYKGNPIVENFKDGRIYDMSGYQDMISGVFVSDVLKSIDEMEDSLS